MSDSAREVSFVQNGLTPFEISVLDSEFKRRTHEADEIAFVWLFNGTTNIPIFKIKEELYT